MYTCDQCGYNTKIKCNYTRHLNKKVPCGLNKSTGRTNKSTVRTNKSTVCTNKSTECTVELTERTEFIPLNDGRIQCTQCNSKIKPLSKWKHINACKGVPPLTCEYCFVCFETRNQKSRHRKVCKQRESYNHNENTPLSIGTQNNNNCNNTTTNNNIDSHDTTNNIVNNTTIINQFNKEDFTGLVNKLKTEFAGMLADVLKSSVDERMITLTRLCYFNDDFPENQTVRKLNKKDATMEVHTRDNKWDLVSVKNTIPKMVKEINETFVGPQTDHDDVDNSLVRTIDETIYHESVNKWRKSDPNDVTTNTTSSSNTSSVLSKYNDIAEIDIARLKFREEFDQWKTEYIRENQISEFVMKMPFMRQIVKANYDNMRKPYVETWGESF